MAKALGVASTRSCDLEVPAGKVDFDDLSVALTLLQRCGWRLAEAEVRPSSLLPSPIWNVNDHRGLQVRAHL